MFHQKSNGKYYAEALPTILTPKDVIFVVERQFTKNNLLRKKFTKQKQRNQYLIGNNKIGI